MTAFLSTTAKRRGAMALRALAVVGLAISLAGCYSQRVAQENYPTDYRERHPIILKEGTRTVEIFLASSRGGLSPDQRADVLAFAQTWRHEATSGIIVDVPQGGPNKHVAADAMRELHAILAASGVPRHAVFVRNYRTGGAALASIKINFTKLVAEAGPCGLWPHDIGPAFDPSHVYTENRPYWNLGCSTQRNLASMVDNPADLVQPRGEAPAYASRRSVVIDKYRKGDSPSATYTGYDSGKISDLGK